MFGDRSGAGHMALQTLLPLVQAATFDAAAKQKADQIGRTFQQLYGSMHIMQGVDVNLVLSQQRPGLDQTLIMQPNLLTGQFRMPTHWEVNVKDSQGRLIDMPPDKRLRMDKLDQTAIFFPVQQNKQTVPVPAVPAQHQGLSEQQIDAICISTVSAVPVTQEKIGGCTGAAQYPTHIPPKPTKNKKVRRIKWTQKNRPDDDTYDVHLDRMEAHRQTLPIVQEEDWESDNLCETDTEGEAEEAQPPVSFVYPGADDIAQAQAQQQSQAAPQLQTVQPQAVLFMQTLHAAPTAQTQPQHIVVEDTDQQADTQQTDTQQLSAQQPTVLVVQQPQAQSVPAHLQLDQVIRPIPDSSVQRTVFTAPIPTTSQSIRARTLRYALMQPPINGRAVSGGMGQAFLWGLAPTPALTPRYMVRPALGASLHPVQGRGQGNFGQGLIYADQRLQFRQRGCGRGTGLQLQAQGLQLLTQQRLAPTGQSNVTGSQPGSSQTDPSLRSRSRSPHK